MKIKIITTARIVFGLAFLIFGLNGFFNFMPTPAPSAQMGELLGAFAKTGYFFPMIKSIETICALLILSNFLVPLAVVLIAPILVGITSIHIFLNPQDLPLMILLHLLHALLIWGYWNYFKSIFIKKAVIS
jgi:uncharacterized membrane protein YphA (DoxX/SURF4 family)